MNELEFRRATFLALKGDEDGSAQWLTKAIERGWAGRPYSSRLQDYPQFDILSGDPRLRGLQRRIDRSIAKERSETSSAAVRRP